MKTLLFILASLFVAASVSAQSRGNIGTTPTVATLTNSVPTSTLGGVVATLGRVTEGDGDGAVYEWDSSSAATVDNELVLPSALSGTGRWLLSIGSGAGGGATVADGDKGDVTVSGSGSVWTVDPAAIAYSKIQDVAAASRFLGRGSASGAGPVQEITAGSGLVFTGTTVSVDTPISSGDKGDITVSTPGGGSFGLTIDNQAVTYGQIQNVSAASRLIGRGSAAGAGSVQEITTGSGLTFSGTALSVTTPLSDGDKGDITVGSGGTTMTVDGGAISYGKIQSASENKLIGRGNGSGAGSVQEITLGAGLVLSGTTLNATALAYFNGMAALDALAKAAVTTNDVPPLVHLQGYYSTSMGHGNGFWYYDPLSTMYTNRAIISVGASGTLGRMLPYFKDGNINVKMFGALDGVTDNTAFQDARFLQQDRSWPDKTFFVPSGDFHITSPIGVYEKGTGSGYVVNNAPGYNIGDTVIQVGTGSGTILVGNNITFAGDTYKYMAVSLSGTTLTFKPGLKQYLPNTTAITVGTPVRSIIKGVARTGSYNDLTGGSAITMDTDNTPIIYVGYEEGLVEGLNFWWLNWQTTADTESAAIRQVPNADIYRHVFRDLSCRRGSRFFYWPAYSGKTTPNNSFENLWGMSGSIGSLHFGNSGTINRFSNIYIQNHGNSPSGSVQVNITAASGTTTLSLTLASVPYLLEVGSYIDVSGLGYTGNNPNSVYIVKTLVGNVITVDPIAANVPTTVTASGTVSTKARAGNEEALLYTGQGFMAAFNNLDIEATRGPVSATVGTPALIDNNGQMTVDFFHCENTFPQSDNASFVRNNGGTMIIGQASFLNNQVGAGRTAYAFYNERPATTRYGTLSIGSLTVRDIANVGSPSLILVGNSAANGGASPVVLNDYITTVTVRQNAKSLWPIGNATKQVLNYQGLKDMDTAITLGNSPWFYQPVYFNGTYTGPSDYRRGEISQNSSGLLTISSGGAGTGLTGNLMRFQLDGTNYLSMTPGSVSLDGSAYLRWSAKSAINSPSDGLVMLQNAANTGFTRLQFGGTTTSFPGLTRNGAGLEVTLADGTTGATLKVGGPAFRVLGNTSTWDPPGVAGGGTETTTIAVTGATVGSPCTVGLTSWTTELVMISARVSAAGTVTVLIYNPTGGAIDLASGTLKVNCFEQ